MINTLVLTGVGIYINYFIGMLKYLNEIGENNIKNIFASSSGGILGFFIALKISIDDIESIFLNYNYNDVLIGHNKSIINNITNLFTKGGLYDTDNFKKSLSSILYKYKNITDITFYELKQSYDVNLIIQVYNFTNKQTEFIDYKCYPHFSIIDAITISMCLPLIFNPIKFNNNYYLDGCMEFKICFSYLEKFDKDNLLIFYIYDSLFDNEFIKINKYWLSKTIFKKINLFRLNFFNLNINTYEKNKYICEGYNLAKEYFNNIN